jgi:CRP-like cAMP-binding protein
MDVRGMLTSTAFFNVVLDAELLDTLAAAVKVVQFAKRDVIVRERELGKSMFALVEGKVSVAKHTPQGDKVIATLGPGDVVGEMSLFTGERRSATVTAAGKVTALEVTKEALQPILAAAPVLTERFAAWSSSGTPNSANATRSSPLPQHRRRASELAARMSAFYEADGGAAALGRLSR